MFAVTVAGLAPAEAATQRPVGAVQDARQGIGGIHLAGWAIDPNVTTAIRVAITLDGAPARTVRANRPNPAPVREHPAAGPNHGFDTTLRAAEGAHRVCLQALNVDSAGHEGGTGTNLGCYSVTIRFSPVGLLHTIPRAVGSTTITVSGWAADPQTDAPIWVRITIDRGTPIMVRADQKMLHARVPYAGMGVLHKYREVYAVTPAAHTVCVVAVNVAAGRDVSLGCQTSPAVPTAPSAPLAVTAGPLQSAAAVSWRAPALDGYSPITAYVVTSTPDARTARVTGSALTATVPGLVAGRPYTFTVTAANAVGASVSSAPSAPVIPIAAPIPPVTSPALISTSRYIRNIRGTSADAAKTFSMGSADGSSNPANHRYLTLLQIGGQTTTGIILSATSVTVSYPAAVSALKSYIDGYAHTQHANAPAIIAIGTNNDVDVRALTGTIWATQVVEPLRQYARKYANITIAGANDIEPGFIGSVHDTEAWLTGYLAGTSAKFVFNGSADGCGWTTTSTACNNGWRATNLQWLSGGAASTRILSLPQVYNTTMPMQWKYVSLTGVNKSRAKVNFAGPLTEWTACYTQGGGCSSLTNNTAWLALWNQLNSDARIAQPSLPYGTDLRIN